EEIMRVLAIVDRLAEGRLSLLKQKRVEALGHSGGLQADHGAERELGASKATVRPRHKPVGGEEFVINPRASLLERVHKGRAVKHEQPLSPGKHDHWLYCGVRLGRRTRG